MQTQLLFTRFLNHHLCRSSGRAAARAAHRRTVPDSAHHERYGDGVLVALVLLGYFVAVRLSLSVETPNGVQHLAEMTQRVRFRPGRADHRARV